MTIANHLAISSQWTDSLSSAAESLKFRLWHVTLIDGVGGNFL
jgi:hypothetical protein